MVLVPASEGTTGQGGGSTDGSTGGAGGTPPTWVFPFDRPLPPGEGDNQALAVNTEDGSVAYDVAFALVWADEDTVLNRNEAYALASCTGCRTVAVAFQVVLLIGSVDVVVPQNISAAVNYACIECVTYALATQLVVTVPGPLSETAAGELAEVWEELRAFGEQIEGVPLSELRDRLTEFEERILAVVREDAGSGDLPVTGTTEETGESPDPSTGAGPTGSGDGSTGSGDGAAPSSGSPMGTGDGGSSAPTGSVPTSEAPTSSTGATATSEPATSSSAPAPAEPTEATPTG
jgi:putative peptide zinc metalloprotease protein